MIKEKITYVDYNGVERTEDFYFNLTEAELLDMQLTTAGGYAETVKAIIDAKDQPALVAIFKELLVKAYGKKTPDGRRFDKSQEIIDDFIHCPAYSQLYMRLVQDDEYAAKFIKGIIPAKLAAEVAKQKQ
ncbi:MAG: hypothetical protein IKZ08_02730 [Bacteroidales bacterium]|nr:hypothetical protein [Bacteroidales bacterium]